MYYLKQLFMQRASLRQGNHKVKTALKLLAVDVNHGVKKELVVLVKVLSVHHNGVVVVLYSVLLHVAIAYKLPKKVRRLAIKSALSSKVLEENIVSFRSLSI